MNTQTRISLIALSIFALTSTASNQAMAKDADAQQANGGLNKSGVPTMLMRPDGDDKFAPDPTKRLKLADFKKGMNKLNEYLENAIKNAKPEDKAFLIKEKTEIVKQIANPEKAHTEMFESIEREYQRLLALKVFPDSAVKQMRKYFLETEAARVLGVLQEQQKKHKDNPAIMAEILYQKGIIADRDQVNYKSALRFYQQAADRNPKNADYLSALSDLYMTLEDYGSAVKRYNELLAIVKTQPDSNKKVKYIKKQLKKALEQVKLAAGS